MIVRQQAAIIETSWHGFQFINQKC